MPRGQIHINLPPGHPIMSFETIEIKMAAVSVKRSIELADLVYGWFSHDVTAAMLVHRTMKTIEREKSLFGNLTRL